MIVAPDDLRANAGLFFASIYAGGLLSVFCTVGLVPLLYRRRFQYTLPLVYGATLIAGIIGSLIMHAYSVLYSVDSPMIWAVGFICGINIFCTLIVHMSSPEIHHFYRWSGHCSSWGYDLTGHKSPTCPECGAVLRKIPRLAVRHQIPLPC